MHRLSDDFIPCEVWDGAGWVSGLAERAFKSGPDKGLWQVRVMKSVKGKAGSTCLRYVKARVREEDIRWDESL